VTEKLISEELLSFLNDFGNVILPGSTNPPVPRWDAEPPSKQFLSKAVVAIFPIESFKNFLSVKFNGVISQLTEEELQAIVSENSTETRNFFKSLGDLYINDYYSRPRTLLALGLSQEAPFPRGNEVFFGDLGKLEMVFNRGRIYR
jgi:hypothetical protein